MDVVDESNLQRQILHNLDRIGSGRPIGEEDHRKLQPGANVLTDVRLDAPNITDIISQFDIVVDGADNFPVRYMLNDASVKLGIPVVLLDLPLRRSGMRSIRATDLPTGHASGTAATGTGLLFEVVLGVLPESSVHPGDRRSLILGSGSSLVGRYLTFDSQDMEFPGVQAPCDPENQITWENRDRIQVVPLEIDYAGATTPHLPEAAA